MADLKLFFAIIATVFGLVGFYPYLRDIFTLKTKPHIYTWLIWTITQGTAVVGLWYGGGRWGGLELAVGTVLIFVVSLLSFRYGTKNITAGDTVVLAVAFLAILAWWQLHEPLLAVMMASAIDALGYIPSFRKSYADPWSETLGTWMMFALSGVFALLALAQYNPLTMTYLFVTALANFALFFFCLARRPSVARK